MSVADAWFLRYNYYKHWVTARFSEREDVTHVSIGLSRVRGASIKTEYKEENYGWLEFILNYYFSLCNGSSWSGSIFKTINDYRVKSNSLSWFGSIFTTTKISKAKNNCLGWSDFVIKTITAG